MSSSMEYVAKGMNTVHSGAKRMHLVLMHIKKKHFIDKERKELQKSSLFEELHQGLKCISSN